MMSNLDTFHELKSESLLPELAECLRTDGSFPVLHHPLVVIPFFTSHPLEVGQANAVLTHKKDRLEEAVQNREYSTVAALYERPYRLEGLLSHFEFKDALSDPKFVKALAYVWTDSENIPEMIEIWESVFDGLAEKRVNKNLMSRQEKAHLASLPKEVIAYCGLALPSQIGNLPFSMLQPFLFGESPESAKRFKELVQYSWTTDRDKAVWFAHRAKRLDPSSKNKPYVLTASLKKRSIAAHFDRRRESELVVPNRSAITLTSCTHEPGRKLY